MKEIFKITPARESLRPAIKKLFADFDTLAGEVLQDDRNKIKKLSLNDATVACKRFKKPNFIKGIIYGCFREGKAKRSYDYASFLLENDIKTPAPIAYYEKRSFALLKESFFLSNYVAYDFTFREIIHQPKMENRELILQQFTAFAFKLHNNGINFLDLSPGNVLVVQESETQYHFYLIDLNRMRFEAMDLNARMKNLRRLWLSKRMIQIIAQEYAVLNDNTYEETHASLAAHSRVFQKSRLVKKIRKNKYGFKF